jgi:hypothetical protein
MPDAVPSESEILERGIMLLKDLLPANWHVQRQADESEDALGSAILNVGGPQGVARVVVEVKRTFNPRDVDAVTRQARLLNRVAGAVPVLVMAPWLSDRSRLLLAGAGINYLDLAGNVRFNSDYPAIFIERKTNASGPRSSQSLPSLRGVKAGRVARLLADVQPPYGVLEIARYTGVTQGYVSRLLDVLEREELVVRTPRGGVTHTDWRELLMRRAEYYGVFTSNRIQTFVCPNGSYFALECARDLRRELAVFLSGSYAAEGIVSVAPPGLLLLYAEREPTPLIEAANLLPADTGANVVIATPYDQVVLERPYKDRAAPPPFVPRVGVAQIALDCLTGNGRMPQEGEAVLDWMAEDESRWRIAGLADLPEPVA